LLLLSDGLGLWRKLICPDFPANCFPNFHSRREKWTYLIFYNELRVFWPGQEFALSRKLSRPSWSGGGHLSGRGTSSYNQFPGGFRIDPIIVGRHTTPMALATIAPLAASPSLNRFADLLGTDDDSAPADDTDDGHRPTMGTPHDDGGSQPLLDNNINAGVGMLAAAPRLTPDNATTQIHRLLEAHDHVLMSAIADITNITTPPPPPAMPTLSDLMTMMERNNTNVLS
jgi:hypothetical protein